MFDVNLTNEQKALVETARRFAKEEIIPVAQKMDEEGTFPADICRKAWEIGLRNLEIPAEDGGLGLSCFDHCLVLEELNYGCTGITTTLAGSSLASTPLIIAGTE